MIKLARFCDKCKAFVEICKQEKPHENEAEFVAQILNAAINDETLCDKCRLEDAKTRCMDCAGFCPSRKRVGAGKCELLYITVYGSTDASLCENFIQKIKGS